MCENYYSLNIFVLEFSSWNVQKNPEIIIEALKVK